MRKKRKTDEAGARYPGRVGVLIRVSRSSRISRAEKKRETEIERRGGERVAKGGASDRRQANGTGGRLPDGRLMEPRADFIFRGPSFLVLSPPSRSGATFVLATGCRNTARYGGSPCRLPSYMCTYTCVLSGKGLSVAR